MEEVYGSALHAEGSRSEDLTEDFGLDLPESLDGNLDRDLDGDMDGDLEDSDMDSDIDDDSLDGGSERSERSSGSGSGGSGVAGAVKGEVKWFNPGKGFGFVRVSEGNRDAFLHVSSLAPHGVSILHPGAEVTCTLTEGARGLQVESLVSIESEGEPQDSSSRFGGGGGGDDRRPPAGPLREVDGTVKFFNARKGFGFVSPDDGGADIFLPARVLTRCGIMSVQPSQRLRMQVRSGLRGLAAESVSEI